MLGVAVGVAVGAAVGVAVGVAFLEGDFLLGDVLGVAEGGILDAEDGKAVGCTVGGVCVEVDG